MSPQFNPKCRRQQKCRIEPNGAVSECWRLTGGHTNFKCIWTQRRLANAYKCQMPKRERLLSAVRLRPYKGRHTKYKDLHTNSRRLSACICNGLFPDYILNKIDRVVKNTYTKKRNLVLKRREGLKIGRVPLVTQTVLKHSSWNWVHTSESTWSRAIPDLVYAISI